MAAIVLLATVLVVVTAVALGLIAAVGGRWRRAAQRCAVAGAVVVTYGAVLGGVGLASRPVALALGAWKCFDDWCVTLVSASPAPADPERRDVVLRVRSRARRVSQRPDDPRAVVLTAAGGAAQVAVPGLDQRLGPGDGADLRFALRVAPGERDVRLQVTEGGFPSRLVIGDENGPWHAPAAWRI